MNSSQFLVSSNAIIFYADCTGAKPVLTLVFNLTINKESLYLWGNIEINVTTGLAPVADCIRKLHYEAFLG